jgi:hypothetical protein
MADVKWSDRWLVERRGSAGNGFQQAMSMSPASSLRERISPNPAMLTHRTGELSLDNAFAFIEGHPPSRVIPETLFS